MPNYRYVAIDKSGKRLRGSMQAASQAAVAERLQQQSCLVLRAEAAGSTNRFFALLDSDIKFQPRIRKAQLAHLTRELSLMLQAGQDVDHALRFLADTSPNARIGRLVAEIRDQVRRGKSLTASLEAHPRVFPRLYISMVRAGEAGSTLAESLGQLADLLERESRLAATIQSAMIYPALLLIAAIGTIVLLLTFVLPQFTPIFQAAGAKLPPLTRFLVKAGAVLRDDGMIILVVLLAMSLAGVRLLREPAARLICERIILHIPLLGALTRRTAAARLMRTTGTLLRNGVGLIQALAITRQVTGTLIGEKIIDSAITQVKSGAPLAAALSSGRFFPLQTIQLVQLGEETGTLSQMALRAANLHDDQVQQTIARMVTLLVPIVTIVMGVIVAGIVASLILAMLSLNDLAL